MQRALGRPTGEASTVLTGRIPVTLMHRLAPDRDRRDTATGLRTHRGALLRHALKVFLESQDR
jgi:hypothetical protein